MKKTITANIGGIVFHIEEDAYQLLGDYLESIRRYFAGREGGTEILADIEARIAELLGTMLGQSRQAVQLADVNSVMQQVGTVEAISGEEGEPEERAQAPFQDRGAEESFRSEAGKRLFRDEDHSIAGGVCAGIAAYFGLNPLWIRLAFIGIAFGFTLLPAMVGPVFLAYIVLWIALPGVKGAQNPGTFRRFFRSGKDKVLAGVCGGIARYFNIDPTLIRVLFVLAVFAGGGGLLIYILLWIVAPEATSLSDEIRMEGQPVTINTLEEQIRKRISPDPKAPETGLSKFLLFPFRLLSRLIQALGPLLIFVVDLIRIFWAVILLIIGVAFIFSIAVSGLSLLGLISASEYHIHLGEMPVDRIAKELSPWLVGFATIGLLIPAFIIFLIGLSLAIKKRVIGPVFGLSLFGLFVISAIGTGFFLIPKLNEFQREAQLTRSQEFSIPFRSLSLLLNKGEEISEENQFYPLSFRIQSYDGPKALLQQKVSARGKTMADARKNAQFISLGVAQADSSLVFDALKIAEEAPFRAQKMEMILYLPEGTLFRMESEMLHMLENELPSNFDEGLASQSLWVVQGSRLICLICRSSEDRESKAADSSGSGDWN